jgi:hypothetical protein
MRTLLGIAVALFVFALGGSANAACGGELKADIGLDGGYLRVISKCEPVYVNYLTVPPGENRFIGYYYELKLINTTKRPLTLEFTGSPTIHGGSIRTVWACGSLTLRHFVSPLAYTTSEGYGLRIYGPIAREAEDVASLQLPRNQGLRTIQPDWVLALPEVREEICKE